MKKFLLPILLLQFTHLFAQPNTHFPTSNTTWYETYHDQYGNDFPYTYLLLNSDTVISGKNYHNLFKPDAYWPNDSVNIGCIREDSLKKIFFYDYSLEYEYLLYDFSKSVGDTIFYGTDSSYPGGYNNEYLIITQIDSVFDDYIYRKRFYTDRSNYSGGHEVWIEGIGSYRGLLSPITQDLACLCSWELYMMEENDTLYSLPGLPSSIEDNEKIRVNQVSIYPNPFTVNTEISFDKIYEIIDIEIYNLQGKLIGQKEYSNCMTIQFNRADLTNGLYFLKIIINKNMYDIEQILLIE